MLFGQKLKKQRLKIKMLQSELSEKTKIPQGTISKLESGGIKSPTFDNAVKFAKALNVPITYFSE